MSAGELTKHRVQFPGKDADFHLIRRWVYSASGGLCCRPYSRSSIRYILPRSLTLPQMPGSYAPDDQTFSHDCILEKRLSYADGLLPPLTIRTSAGKLIPQSVEYSRRDSSP